MTILTYSKPHRRPGTPVYIGEQKLEEMSALSIVYDRDTYEQTENVNIETFEPAKGKVNFLLIRGLHEEERIVALGKKLGLHPLSIEDILHTRSRNKLEEYPEYFLFIMRLIYVGEDERFYTEQLSLVLKENLLCAFTESERPDLSDLFERIEKGSPLRGKDPDDLLTAVVDWVVDSFFDTFDGLARRFDTMEERITVNPQTEQLEGIHGLKKDLVHFREVLWPLRENLSKLSKSYFQKVDGDTQYYVRDVEDHVIQLIQLVETYQEINASFVDLYISAVGNRTNEVMKVLTMFSTVFIPLTFLAGVYGMNFRYMPELYQRWTYPLFWVICLVTLFFMVRYFRKKKWI